MINKIKALLKIIIFYTTILLIAVFSVTLNQTNLNFKFTQKALNYQKKNLNYSNRISNKTNTSKEDVYKNSIIEMNKPNNDNIGWDSHTVNGHDTRLMKSSLHYGHDFKVEGSAFAEKKRVGKLGDATLGFSMKIGINKSWSNKKQYEENAYGSIITKKDQDFIFEQKVLLTNHSKITLNVKTPDYSGYKVIGSSVDFGGGELNKKLKNAYDNQYFLAKEFINSNEWKNNEFIQNKALKWNISIYLKRISFDELTYHSYDDDGWGDSSVDNFKFFGISFKVGWEVKIKDISIEENIYNKKIFISSFALDNTNWTGTKLEGLIQLRGSDKQNIDFVINSIQLDKKNRIIKLNVNISYKKKKFKSAILKIPIHVYSLNYLVSISKSSSKQWNHIASNNKKYHSLPPITQLEISSNFLKSLKMFTARKSIIRDIQNGDGWPFMSMNNKKMIINKVNSYAINYVNINWFKRIWSSNNHINLNNISPPVFINKYLNDNDWDDSTSWDEYLFLLKKATFSINSSAIVDNAQNVVWNFNYQNIKVKGKITLNGDDISKNDNKTIWEMKVNNLRVQNQKEKIIGNQIIKLDKPLFNFEKTDLNIKYDVAQNNKSIIHKYFFQPKPIDISEDVSFTLANGTVLDKNFLIASGKDKGQPGWTSIRYFYNDGNASKYVLLQKINDKYFVPEKKGWISDIDKFFDKNKIEYIFNDDVQMIINPYEMNGQKIGPGIIKASTIKKYGISKVEDKFNGETKILEDWNDGKWSHSYNDKGAILDGLFGVDLNGYADGAGRLGVGSHKIEIYLQNQGPTAFKKSFKLIIDKSISELKVLPVERKLGTATIQVKPSNYLLWSKNKLIIDDERYQNGFILIDKRVNSEWINQKEFYIKLNSINNINLNHKIWLYDPNGLKLFWLDDVSKQILEKWSKNIGKYLKVKAPNLKTELKNEKKKFTTRLIQLRKRYSSEYEIPTSNMRLRFKRADNWNSWNSFYNSFSNVNISKKLSAEKALYIKYLKNKYSSLNKDATYDKTLAELENLIVACKTFTELRKLDLSLTQSKAEEVPIDESGFASSFTDRAKESWDLPWEQFDGKYYSSMYMSKNDNDKTKAGIVLNIYDSPGYLQMGEWVSGYEGKNSGSREIMATKTSDFEDWKISLVGSFSSLLWSKHKTQVIHLKYINNIVKEWKNSHNNKINKIEVTFRSKNYYKTYVNNHGYDVDVVKGVYSYLKAKMKIFYDTPLIHFNYPNKNSIGKIIKEKININHKQGIKTNDYKVIQTPLSISREQEFPIYFSNGSIKFTMYDFDIKSIQADLLASDGKWYEIPININTQLIDGKYYKVINSTINYAGFARVQIMDQSNNIKTVYFKLSPNSKSVVPDLMFKTQDVINTKNIPKNWMGQKITFINPSAVLSVDPLVTDINIQKLTLNQNGYINKTNATNQEVSISDYQQKIAKGYSFGSTIGESGLKYAGDELKPFLKNSDTKLASWSLNDKKMYFKESGLYQVILKTRLSENPIVKQFIYVKPSIKKDFMNEKSVLKEKTNFDLGNDLDRLKPTKNKDAPYSIFREYKLHYWPFLINKVSITYSYLWYSDFFKVNIANDLSLLKEGKYIISLTSIFGNTFSHKILVLDKFKTTMSRKMQKINMIAKDPNKLEETAFWKGNKIWNDWRWVDQDYWQWSYEEFKRIGLKKGLTIEQINTKWKKWNQSKDWNGKWVTGILIDKRKEWEKKKHIVKIIKPFEKWTFNSKNNTYTHNDKTGILSKTGNGKWKIGGFDNLNLIKDKKGKLILVTDSSILNIIKSSLGEGGTNTKNSLYSVLKLKDGFLIDKQGSKKLLINTLNNHFVAIANGKYHLLTKDKNNKWINKDWTFDLKNKTYIHDGKTGVLSKDIDGKWNIQDFAYLSLIQSKGNKFVLGNKKEFIKVTIDTFGQNTKWITNQHNSTLTFKDGFLIDKQGSKKLLINTLNNHFVAITNGKYHLLTKDKSNKWINKDWTFDLKNKTYIHDGKTGVLSKGIDGKWNIKGFTDLNLVQSKNNKLVLGNKNDFLEIRLERLGQESKLIIHKKSIAILETFKDSFLLHDKDGNILVINPNSYSKLSKDLNGNWVNQKRIIGFTGSGTSINVVKEEKVTTQRATSKAESKWQIGLGILGCLIFIAILTFIKKRWKFKKIK